MTIHVLLIEDEVRMARLLKLDLNDVGYRVTVAHNGLTGWQLAKMQAPDVIVLDWQLPQLTGLEVCQRLREAGKMMPIIFATALGDSARRRAALQAGGTNYLVKPFSSESLLKMIKNCQAVAAEQPAAIQEAGCVGSEIVTVVPSSEDSMSNVPR